MTLYRKKPITIEAIQWDGNGIDSEPNSGLSIIRWIRDNGGKASLTLYGIHIETLEGTMIARIGWWIIKGVNGEFYPCAPDIFEKTYEKVEK